MTDYQSGNFVTSGDNCLYANVTAGTSLIKTGAGQLYGIIINSHSSGTMAFFDHTTNSGTKICNTITLAAGERNINLYGVTFGTACTVAIGGTADVTIAYR